MTTNQNELLAHILCLVKDYSTKTFLEKFYLNTCSETEIKDNFHFSHYKSMETLSCYSNRQSIYAAARKKKIVEANAMNISVKFQLYPQYSFWGVEFLK